MTDVAQGGSTVFLNLGVAVRPVRGTAVVWHNLLPDGTGDPRTLHAACPVLRGSKWSNYLITCFAQNYRENARAELLLLFTECESVDDGRRKGRNGDKALRDFLQKNNFYCPVVVRTIL